MWWKWWTPRIEIKLTPFEMLVERSKQLRRDTWTPRTPERKFAKPKDEFELMIENDLKKVETKQEWLRVQKIKQIVDKNLDYIYSKMEEWFLKWDERAKHYRKYEKEIAKINNIEQRVWTVWKNKVWPEYKKK